MNERVFHYPSRYYCYSEWRSNRGTRRAEKTKQKIEKKKRKRREKESRGEIGVARAEPTYVLSFLFLSAGCCNRIKPPRLCTRSNRKCTREVLINCKLCAGRAATSVAGSRWGNRVKGPGFRRWQEDVLLGEAARSGKKDKWECKRDAIRVT